MRPINSALPEQTHFEGPRIFEPLGKEKESATEPHSEFSVRPPQPRGRPTGGGTAAPFDRTKRIARALAFLNRSAKKRSRRQNLIVNSRCGHRNLGADQREAVRRPCLGIGLIPIGPIDSALPPQTHSGKIPGTCGRGVAGKESA